MLASEIAKDLTLLNSFLAFLTARKLDGVVIAKMPDTAVFGVYMDFLEQEYNIGVTADNASYNLYYIPQAEGDKHYSKFINDYRNNGNEIIFNSHTLTICTTVIDRYIAGITTAIRYIILPF